jgi:TrmH family RNA methyltransferase
VNTVNVLTERSERLRSARKLTRRSGRDKAGLFLAEGIQAAREAVAQGSERVVELIVAESARQPDILAIAESAVEHAIPVRSATDAAAATLSETVTPQGVVAVCRSVSVAVDAIPLRPRLVPVLAEARDPGNAGTVVRCADAAGADAVVFTHGSVDPQGGKAVRASAGSIFHLPVAVGATTSEAVSLLRDRGLGIVAADGRGDRDLHSADDVLAKPTAWIFGNEAWGLPPDLLNLADDVIRVPIYGRAESLNLATAAALCLYASAQRQRE